VYIFGTLFAPIRETKIDMKQLTFKWGVSRGRYTYGYNICSLYVEGKKVASCNGGGYDMKGTCFGDWIEKEFQEQLKTLNLDEFYGLQEYDGKRILDGACGFSSMERILKALGYKLTYLRHAGGKNDELYLVENI